MSRTETDGDVRQVDLQVPVNGATMQCALRLRGDLAALTDATGEHVLQCAAVLGDPGSLPVRAWTAMLQDDLGIVPEIVSDRDLGGLVDQPGLSFPLLLVVPDAHELRASLWEKVVLPALQRGMGLVAATQDIGGGGRCPHRPRRGQHGDESKRREEQVNHVRSVG